jgi:membrane-bound serine protease (ClpP class)
MTGYRMRRRPFLAILIAIFIFPVGLMAAEQKKSGENSPEPKRFGRILRLSLPLQQESISSVSSFLDQVLDVAARSDREAVLIFEMVDEPEKSERYRQTSQFGISFEIARILTSERLGRNRTVAWIRGPLDGHAVLVAAACDEILIDSRATIGDAGATEKTIDEALESGYREIASRRGTIPVQLALAMLNPGQAVWEVVGEKGRQFVSPQQLEGLLAEQTVLEKKLLVRPDRMARFDATEARRLGIADRLVDNQSQLADALELPSEKIEDLTAALKKTKAVRVDLTGVIDAGRIDAVRRRIEQAIRRDDANLIILYIDSPGGSVADSLNLANYLAFDLDPAKIRTVAYIPAEALADAALIALACDRRIVREGAVLGGTGASVPSQDEIEVICDSIRERLAPKGNFDWSLPCAMFDPKLDVYRYGRKTRERFLCQQELKELTNPNGWVRENQVTTPDQLFKTVGSEAVEFHLADQEVDDFAQLKSIFGLEDDPTLVEPNWADHLIESLASPALAVFFLTIAGAAFYAEMHTPGLGLGAFLAGIFVMLFFWSQYLGGTAGWLEALLFFAGIGCILLEVFVIPGFGIFGLGGGALVLISVVLACQTFILPRNPYQFGQFQNSLLVVLISGTGIAVLGYWMNRWLPKTPLLGKIMLPPLSDEQKDQLNDHESLTHFESLIGQEGKTLTPLNPSGKARIENKTYDVITEGQPIKANQPVQVVEVHGNRILVVLIP